MHIHLFEFTDKPWCPQILRQYMTDYLHFLITKVRIYKPAVPLLKEVIDKTGIDEILDLCSGSGGGVDIVQKELSEQTGRIIRLTMSDKYPSPEIYEMLKKNSNGGLDYIKVPVDALHVPNELNGIRTIFSAYHHFRPEEAKNILKNAVDNNTPICIFEGAGKRIMDFMGILLLHSIIFILVTPFIKPFRISRIFLTYIIPVVPITTIWDGLVSILRMHTPKDMLRMANEINAPNYMWKAEIIKGKFGNRLMYMVGYPESKI
jgi:hypothetical protein